MSSSHKLRSFRKWPQWCWRWSGWWSWWRFKQSTRSQSQWPLSGMNKRSLNLLCRLSCKTHTRPHASVRILTVYWHRLQSRRRRSQQCLFYLSVVCCAFWNGCSESGECELSDDGPRWSWSLPETWTELSVSVYPDGVSNGSVFTLIAVTFSLLTWTDIKCVYW